MVWCVARCVFCTAQHFAKCCSCFMLLQNTFFWNLYYEAARNYVDFPIFVLSITIIACTEFVVCSLRQKCCSVAFMSCNSFSCFCNTYSRFRNCSNYSNCIISQTLWANRACRSHSKSSKFEQIHVFITIWIDSTLFQIFTHFVIHNLMCHWLTSVWCHHSLFFLSPM